MKTVDTEVLGRELN